ncbi:hypothetical protein [Streptomyces sp. MMG1121]|uniref:hypothetical protein n=1 Tax=Streptomyces sp. MMG1121 TaxID=1415544 RepID=UPI0006AE8FA5|nr:hypothetical protein [Streptomyces sp. MMG1121]KOV57858.1 hypothetical protein ADK64_38010 [Streptomyces sp. MMG1121]
MSPATPTPEQPARRAELACRAWAEARCLAGAADRAPALDTGPAHPPLGELTADALRAYSALSAGLGRSIPVTGLGPGGGGVRGLATFLAVYAGQYERQDPRGLGAAA